MRNRISALLVTGLTIAAAATPSVAMAKHGTDDPAGHARHGHGSDDVRGHHRHGGDDGPNHR